MINGNPVVLIASVSPYEGRALERMLKKTGWTLLRVQDAGDAAREIQDARRAVLLIDAGLLQMAHDAQWRTLRARHPRLGTVVRCLVQGTRQRQDTDGRTIEVHPDDLEGMCQAIREHNRD